MILYRKSMLNNKKERAHRTVKINLEELPTRNEPKYNTPRDREKHIKTCEKVIRGSEEYKRYIKFLRDNVQLDRCIILKNLKNADGKRYRIEMHHEPFTLFDIVETVINKRLENGESISALKVSDEVMNLHYEGLVGLVPLTVTMHELTHSGRIFIPLQFVYGKYNEFFEEYQEYMNEGLKEKIEAKVALSLQTDAIVSDSLDVEFIDLEVDGFKFPQVPEEWSKAIITPDDLAD